MNQLVLLNKLCEQILRLPAVIALTGKCRSTIYCEMAANRFPHQKKISRRAVGWSAREIDDYIRITLAGGEYFAV